MPPKRQNAPYVPAPQEVREALCTRLGVCLGSRVRIYEHSNNGKRDGYKIYGNRQWIILDQGFFTEYWDSTDPKSNGICIMSLVASAASFPVPYPFQPDPLQNRPSCQECGLSFKSDDDLDKHIVGCTTATSHLRAQPRPAKTILALPWYPEPPSEHPGNPFEQPESSPKHPEPSPGHSEQLSKQSKPSPECPPSPPPSYSTSSSLSLEWLQLCAYENPWADEVSSSKLFDPPSPSSPRYTPHSHMTTDNQSIHFRPDKNGFARPSRPPPPHVTAEGRTDASTHEAKTHRPGTHQETTTQPAAPPKHTETQSQAPKASVLALSSPHLTVLLSACSLSLNSVQLSHISPPQYPCCVSIISGSSNIK